MDTTQFLAYWGAGLSTVLALANLRRFWNERPRLRVEVESAVIRITYLSPEGYGVTHDSEITPDPHGNPPFLAFRVTNIGGNSIIVTKIGGGYRGGSDFAVHNRSVEFPKKLEPGEFINIAGSLSLIRSDLRYLGAWDSRGKLWKAGWLQTLHLREHSAQDRGKPTIRSRLFDRLWHVFRNKSRVF
jgi:hypothetical protein